MPQANRCIRGNPDLDDVDHALGRPWKPFHTYRNHYATDCPNQKAKFDSSPWWDRGITRDGMTFFHVNHVGRSALKKELAKTEIYGRLFRITSKNYDGETLITASTHSQAKYRAWIEADIDWTFMEYCKEIRVRLAA